MLCPEGEAASQGNVAKEEVTCQKKSRKVPVEGTGHLELNSFKNPKTWKKSITNFFRHQLRSTKSNDGDHPSGSKEKFEDKDIAPEQKWQSLGKVFRRQSFAEHWNNKTSNQQGECSSAQSKRVPVRKGDHPSGSKEKFEDKDIAPEQKWQSLGKVFRRQSFAEHWNNKTSNQQGECSSAQSKRVPVRKVLSSYFGKSHKSQSQSEYEEN